MKKGDNVRLKKAFQALKAGASGVIKKDYGNIFTVQFERDRFCKALNPSVKYNLKSEYLEKGKCPTLILVSEAAIQVNKSKSTIYRYIRTGVIFGFKDTNRNVWLIFKESIKL